MVAVKRRLNKIKRDKILCLITFTVLLLIDRITKLIAINLLKHKGSVTFMKLIDLRVIYNRGIALSLWQEWGVYLSLFGFLVVIAYLLVEKELHISLVMILAGSFSNLIDRLFYNGVVDFISLNIPKVDWIYFNLADIFIALGSVLLILYKGNFYKKWKT